MNTSKLSNLSINRLLKYCFVGAVGAIINYMVFIPLRHIEFKFPMVPWFIVNIGWGVGILVATLWNYTINELWTWREDKRISS